MVTTSGGEGSSSRNGVSQVSLIQSSDSVRTIMHMNSSRPAYRPTSSLSTTDPTRSGQFATSTMQRKKKKEEKAIFRNYPLIDGIS
uniref:Uncharacterized protein n=1 Tax=Caenorhabditis japonica TaxID=281687 RepID=A0A8R1DSK1_CAEJA